jgi:hypothetical protein
MIMATREENKQNAEQLILEESKTLGNPIKDTGWIKEGANEVRTVTWNTKFFGKMVPINHRFELDGDSLSIRKKRELIDWKSVWDYENWGNGARALVVAAVLLFGISLGLLARNYGYAPWFPTMGETWTYIASFWPNDDSKTAKVDVKVDATPKTDPPKVEVTVTPSAEPPTVKAEIIKEPPTSPTRRVASVVDTVKADVRAKVQLSLDQATKLYDAAKADFETATAKFNRLNAMKMELGKDWCNEAQLVEAKAKADAATQTMDALTRDIYLFDEELKHGGGTIMTVSMIQGIDSTLQQRMAAFESRMEAKLDKTSGELKTEMKSVKDTVNNMKTEVLEKIAALEKSIGANLSKILSTIASIPGQTAEDLKDLAKLIEDVKKEVAKHKDSPSKIAAIEIRLQDMAEKLSKPTPIPQAEVKPAPTMPAPVQKSAPIQAPMIQGAYAPNCPQGWQCPTPQYRPAYGYVRQN